MLGLDNKTALWILFLFILSLLFRYLFVPVAIATILYFWKDYSFWVVLPSLYVCLIVQRRLNKYIEGIF